MKTYTNTTRESIKSAICETFKVAELKDYADTLVGYFCDKAEAWMTAVRHTHTDKWEAEAERKYGAQTGKPRYELETATDDLKTVLRWREEIDHYIDCAVAQERENPVAVEYEDSEEDGVNEGNVEAIMEYHMQLRNRYTDTLHVWDILGLYERTYGLDDQAYRDMLDEYDVRERI